MKLKLALNIGAADARRLDLDRTLEGEEVDVKQPVADELLKRGWALDPASYDARVAAARKEAAASAPILPPAPGAPAGEPPPNLDAMTKEELKAYADARRIPGVTPAMGKDELIRTIRKANPGNG